MKNVICIGGVPEHFNFPWHYAMEKNWFENNDIILEWQDYPNGTGAMCSDLRDKKLDLALVLTEGIIADICKGNPSKLICPYVKSPLLWGIHVPYSCSIYKPEDLKGKKIAISRYGSGSHLMAFVDALKRGWNPNDLEFVPVENLDGARKAFKEKKAEVFFWEKFTTKPYVDGREFRYIDTRPTPWPCFHLAGRTEFINQNTEVIININSIIQRAISEIKEDQQKSILEISSRYKLNEQDVKEWFSLTDWANGPVDKPMIEEVETILHALNLIPEKIDINRMCI